MCWMCRWRGKSGFMRRTHAHGWSVPFVLVWRSREIIGMPSIRTHPCKIKRLALVRVIRCSACYCPPCAVRCGLSLTKGVLHCKGLLNVTVPLATISPCPSKSSHLRATIRKQKMKAYYSFVRGLFFLGAALLIIQNVVTKPRSYWRGGLRGIVSWFSLDPLSSCRMSSPNPRANGMASGAY